MSLTFSDSTLQILKNFASINSGLSFKEGNTLRTVSPQKTTLVEAVIDEVIPQNFCIHDMNSFLAVISMHKETPKLEFDEKNVFIKASNGKSKVTYRCCDESVITTPPNATINMNKEDVKFTLTEEDFSWILKSASVLGSPNISVIGDGEKLYLKTSDAQDDSASTDSYEIGTTTKVCNFIFKTENWKMIPGSYEVTIQLKDNGKGGISLFNNTTKKLKYWLAIELGSSITGE